MMLGLLVTTIAIATQLASASDYTIPKSQKPLSAYSVKTSPGHKTPLAQQTNGQYACNITVGTPPQKLEVAVDTSTSQLFLPNAPCNSTDPNIPICQGTFSIGDLTVQNQPFTEPDFPPGVNINLDGIMGLGYQNLSIESGTTPFYGMIAQGLLDQPVYSLYLSDVSHNNSELVLGGTNVDNYDGDLVWLPVRHGGYWAVDLNSLTLGDETFGLDATGAIFASGTTEINMLASLANRLNQEIGAQMGPDGLSSVDCGKLQGLPDLTITLAGHDFTLTSSDYITRIEDKCISSFVALDLEPPAGPAAFLGTPFLRRWYSVYNAGNDTIGLAKAT